MTVLYSPTPSRENARKVVESAALTIVSTRDPACISDSLFVMYHMLDCVCDDTDDDDSTEQTRRSFLCDALDDLAVCLPHVVDSMGTDAESDYRTLMVIFKLCEKAADGCSSPVICLLTPSQVDAILRVLMDRVGTLPTFRHPDLGLPSLDFVRNVVDFLVASAHYDDVMELHALLDYLTLCTSMHWASVNIDACMVIADIIERLVTADAHIATTPTCASVISSMMQCLERDSNPSSSTAWPGWGQVIKCACAVLRALGASCCDRDDDAALRREKEIADILCSSRAWAVFQQPGQPGPSLADHLVKAKLPTTSLVYLLLIPAFDEHVMGCVMERLCTWITIARQIAGGAPVPVATGGVMYRSQSGTRIDFASMMQVLNNMREIRKQLLQHARCRGLGAAILAIEPQFMQLYDQVNTCVLSCAG